MSIPIVGQVLSLISGGISSVFGYKSEKLQTELKKRGIELDEKKLEALKEVTEIEFQRYVLENSLEIDKNFRNFVTDYEGDAKDVHSSVQFLRAIIRPFITIWSVGLISYLMFADPAVIKNVATNMSLIPDKLWDIFFIVFAFWFGGRAVQHIIDRYTKGRVAERKEEVRGEVQVAIEHTNQEKVRAEAAFIDEMPRTHFTEEEVDEAMPRASHRHKRKFGRQWDR